MPEVFVSPGQQIHENTPPVLPEKEPTTEAEKISVPGHTHNRFSAFSLYPDGIDFETKEDKERVILMLRQHPITNAKWILISLILLNGPTVFSLLGIFSLLPTGFPLVITLAWYMVISTYAIEGFLNWYFNVYFITSLRIIDVDFFNLINKKVSDAEVTKIQDVSYTTGGVIRTMFNYGNVLIQTAAEIQEFKFEAVPNPEKVAKILDDFMAKE